MREKITLKNLFPYHIKLEVRMYDYYKNAPCEYDEFMVRGMCAINPSQSSLQEVTLIYLKELAYYLVKLKEFGANNEVIKSTIIEAISGIIVNIDYNEEQFKKLIFTLSQDLSEAKTIYADLSKKNNVEPMFVKSYFKHTADFSLSEVVKKGEKYFIQRNIDFTSEQKNLYDIMILLIKRLCFKIIQVKSYKKNYDKAYDTILTLLNALNCDDIKIKKIKSLIEESTQEYHNLLNILYKAQEEAHGKRQSVYISFAPRNGKALLVSGIDMTQLESVLKATKGKGVDVYTHGITMLMAHTLAKFKKYPNLVGHYGKGAENSLFDFASFPGAILMTKYLFQKVEYLYRGRLFTTDSFAPAGIIKIKNNDFEPLIQAALTAKGFTKAEQKVIKRVGFKQKEMEEKVQDVVTKMITKKIKHLYIIGLLNEEDDYKEYFDKFLKILPKDCFALSLSHNKNEENILHIDSFYDYLFIYKVLGEINERKSLNELNITIFITKCDQSSLTNVVNFINIGIKNIFLCKCVPTLLNPALAQTIRRTFGINEFSTPEQDLKKTLSE